DESGFILDKDTPAPYLHTYYLMTCVNPALALSLA
ncbi:unnamed protein product, partial [marine sediment metagenome]